MRRFVTLVAIFFVLAVLADWAPWAPPYPPLVGAQRAGAQPTVTGPGGVINYTVASVGIRNTTNELQIFKYTIMPGWMATSSYLSVTGTTTSVNVVGASVPLHLSCNGRIATANAATMYLGVNYGGQAATLTLMNGNFLPNGPTTGAPWHADVWLAPIASATSGTTGAGIGGATVLLTGRIAFGVNSFASETAYMGTVVGTTTLSSAQELNVQGRFGAAAASSAWDVHNCVLVQGS